MKHDKCSGFTLVELLVVIAIIGILVSLLLPAIQAAREAAQRIQCSNHLKQLSLGMLTHESAAGQYPTGGWGFAWIGDPDKGTDWKQPGGWIFNVLPFIEQEAVYQLQAGKTGAARRAAGSRMISTPLSIMHCPSRREAKAYETASHHWHFRQPLYAEYTTHVARSDYAANSGDTYTSPPAGALPISGSGPPDYPTGVSDAWKRQWDQISASSNGIVTCASRVAPRHVLDGTSKTLLLGEKYLSPDHYTNGQAGGDNENMYMGDDEDIHRWTDPGYPPYQDRPGLDARRGFGSVHPGGFNVAFCDGSVQMLSFLIDLEVLRRLGNRKDGLGVNRSEF